MSDVTETAAKEGEARVPKPSKPSAERSNKKAVIAMMKRAKSAKLAEIMEATGWQKHTVRGFVSFWVARAGRRSSRPRTPPGNGRTRSRKS